MTYQPNKPKQTGRTCWQLYASLRVRHDLTCKFPGFSRSDPIFLRSEVSPYFVLTFFCERGLARISLKRQEFKRYRHNLISDTQARLTVRRMNHQYYKKGLYGRTVTRPKTRISSGLHATLGRHAHAPPTREKHVHCLLLRGRQWRCKRLLELFKRCLIRQLSFDLKTQTLHHYLPRLHFKFLGSELALCYKACTPLGDKSFIVIITLPQDLCDPKPGWRRKDRLLQRLLESVDESVDRHG